MNKFKLDPRQTAILVNDLQNINLRLPGAPLPRTTMTENILRLLAAGRRVGAQPVLVHAGGAPDGADRLKPLTDAPVPAAVPLPEDWSDLLPELDRQPGDIVILKRQWGAFYGTDLDLQLRRRKLGTIVLCGIATELGVESTARQAHELGYNLVFASDGMTGMVAESHADAIDRLFPRIGRVRSADQIIAAFDA